MITFQAFLNKLTVFWEQQGCIIHQGYDLEIGAGTSNPSTFLRCLGPEPYYAAYIEPCRRPADGRYGKNPNRLQHYFQFQVILKPSPENIQDLYLQSLEALGFKLKEHDIRFVHDDWENPTLGAWGLGWEVWMDGMEITQFTYFQSVGGLELKPITGEITYGVERLAMYLQKVNSVFDLQWNQKLTYGDIYYRNELEWSQYNFEKASTSMWFKHFEDYEKEAKNLISEQLPIPAYDFVMKAAHSFNILDARGAISVTERTGYIARIRDLARQIAEAYTLSREKQGYPLLKKGKFQTIIANTLFEQPLLASSLVNASSTDKEDFLLEIGSEELPASFVTIGSQNLEKQVRSLLEKEEIEFECIHVFATPRRLSICIQQLAMSKAVQMVEKRGPSIDQAYALDGQLTPAGAGFFRSLGIASPKLEAILQGRIDGLEIRVIKGISYLFRILQQEGKATAKILQEKLPSLILNLEFPKKMRWSDGEILYARPLHWIVSLFGEEIVPFHVGHIQADRITYGHRQLAPQAQALNRAQDYLPVLRRLFVMADPEERKQNIHAQLSHLENQLKANIIEKDHLIPQVLNLVEWPHLTSANFQHEFLQIPKEVLISEMVEHQKYFPVTNADGSLKNMFIITANLPATDQIREGNQRVLSARLSDGVFLYEEDLKLRLEDFNEKLKKVIFQKELGTVYQKIERITAHALIIQNVLQISTPAKTRRAAMLCKADLASNMVYEFPELQGVMGTYYALAQKEDSEVAQAIHEHWMPRGENAPLPETETGTIISLADKLDNLLSCFSLNLKPTSSSDPYALRRQMLGMIKIIIKNQFVLPLKECLLACIKNFPSSIVRNRDEMIDEIFAFIINRMKTVLQDYGFHKDEIEANLAYGCNDIYDTFCRVKALHAFRKQAKDQFNSLYEVYKRAKGQLSNQHSIHLTPEYLTEPAEQQFNILIDHQEKAFQKALIMRDYNQAYALISTIQPALATLFDQVKILADDPKIRENRLALLQRVFNLFGQILDFSKIQEKRNHTLFE